MSDDNDDDIDREHPILRGLAVVLLTVNGLILAAALIGAVVLVGCPAVRP